MAGLDITVTGGDKLRAVALELRRQGTAGRALGRELDRGLREAARDVETEVRRHTDDYMPRGYEQVFRRALEFRTVVRKTYEHRVTLTATGRGRSRERDLRRMDEGELRHPVYGRWRARRGVNRGKHKLANPWVAQRIRVGWFTEPAQRAAPAAAKRMEQALNRVADKIEKAG